MCMIDYADGYNEFSRELTRRAKKQHHCDECGRTIEPGEQYIYSSWKFDGGIGNAKTCQHCKVACDWLNENCHGYIVESVYDDIREHVEAYAGRAACIPRLARIVVGMDHKWRFQRGPRKGQLIPIPEQPPKLEPKSIT